ncbi:MAG TPA: hypothetical protein VN962_03530 [Polyangia bacterium]|nr:hypothetical protein [Polyangia bacterium]
MGLAAALVSCFSMSCASSPDGATADDTSTAESALAQWSSFTRWPRGTDGFYRINVCFRLKQLGSSPPPNWSQDKATVMSALANTWQAYSAVVFQSQGDCPTPTSSAWLPVEMQYNSDGTQQYGGQGTAGPGARLDPSVCTDCQVVLGYSPDYFMYRASATHEFGHSLGFRHERARADFTGCQDLESGTWDPGTPGAETGPLMTASWDIESIMGEWQCWVTREHDARDYYYLSAGDIAGVKMVYPYSFNRTTASLGSPAGFHTANGLVVRSDGYVETDWTESGASTTMFSTVPSWSTVKTGVRTGVGSGYQVAASVLATHAFDTIYASYVDVYGRTNTVQDKVTISSPVHAALIGSAGVPL